MDDVTFRDLQEKLRDKIREDAKKSGDTLRAKERARLIAAFQATADEWPSS